jgi:hypothetical protein
VNFPVPQLSSNVASLSNLAEHLGAIDSIEPRLENPIRGVGQNESLSLPAILSPSVNIASLASRLRDFQHDINQPAVNQSAINEDQTLLAQIQSQRAILNTLRELENSRRNVQLNSSPFGLPYPQQFHNTSRLGSQQYSDHLLHSNPIEYATRENASSILAQSLQRRELMISSALNMERLQQQASLYAHTTSVASAEEKQPYDRMSFTSSSVQYPIMSVAQQQESPSSSDSGNNRKPKAKR